jgi:hypothetical protein
MVNSGKHLIPVAVVAAALAVLLALAVAGGSGAQEPQPPQPPPIPTTPTVPTMPNVPKIPDVPEVPEDPKDIGAALDPLAARLMLTANPRRAAGLPATYRINGWVMPPRGLGKVSDFFRKSLGLDFGMCKGRVNFVYKAAGRIYATRSVVLHGICSFTTRIKIPTRGRVWGARQVKAIAQFGGNDLLAKARHEIALPVP